MDLESSLGSAQELEPRRSVIDESTSMTISGYVRRSVPCPDRCVAAGMAVVRVHCLVADQDRS